MKGRMQRLNDQATSILTSDDHHPSSENDTLNELPVGLPPIQFSNVNHGVKRIGMEGTVSEVPNVFKRFGKYSYQPRVLPPTNLQKASTTSLPSTTTTIPATIRNMTTFRRHSVDAVREEMDKGSDELDSQQENEIIRPDVATTSISSYQSQKLSM